MILPLYLARKFFKAFLTCVVLSYSIFFIFSLMGNLGEKLSFKNIFFLSALNSFQIFTYIPSYLFILSLCLFVFNLKSKNELIIIKEYFDLKKLFLIIFPILVLFIYAEINKENLSNTIEKTKSNVINSKKIENTKIFISLDGNTKKYIIFSRYDQDNALIHQYLSFESQKQKIHRGEISTNLYLNDSDLFSNNSTIYENNNFQNENINKKLFANFTSFWTENTGTIVKNKIDNLTLKYSIIQILLFNFLFYLCISMVFFSKRLANRNINSRNIFLLVLFIFLYFLLVPKIILNNFHHYFQIISLIIFSLTFFKIKNYE